MAERASDRLTLAYMMQVRRVRDGVLNLAVVSWNTAPSLRDADVDRLIRRITPVVQAGQVQVANITNAYVGRLAELEGSAFRAPRVDRDEIVGYRGVAASEVYRRPAVATYGALSQGKTFDIARREGLNRLRSIVSTDIQQARNRQATAAYGQSEFAYTVRVLSGAENCALCVIASTQRYRRAQLQPIHPGCDCGQRGVVAGRDPGQVIDDALLELTRAEIESRLGLIDPSSRDLGIGKVDSKGRPISDFTDLIVSRQHGELGPTLTWRSNQFTSEADIEALN